MPRSSLFTLGGIVVPYRAARGFQQLYEPAGGITDLVMADGSLKTQQRWSKTLTRMSGNGQFPVGLSALSRTATHVLMCGAERAISSTSNVITLPAARRTDSEFLPYGHAVVNGMLVATSINVVGDVATLGVVAGASIYVARYFPQLSVRIIDAPEDVDGWNAEWPWQIVCREV